MTAKGFARFTGIDPDIAKEILQEKRGIEPPIAKKLAKCFHTSQDLWENLQRRYEIDVEIWEEEE